MGKFVSLFGHEDGSISLEDLEKLSDIDEIYDWIWRTNDKVCVKYITIYFTNIINILRILGWKWDEMYVNNREFVECNLNYHIDEVIIDCYNVFNVNVDVEPAVDLRIHILPAGMMLLSFIQGNERIMEFCHDYITLSHFVYPPDEDDTRFDKFIATFSLIMNVDVHDGGFTRRQTSSRSKLVYYEPDGEWKYVEKTEDTNNA